jgi:hypothetical protein
MTSYFFRGRIGRKENVHTINTSLPLPVTVPGSYVNTTRKLFLLHKCFYELVLFSKYNYNYQVKENEMGGACSTNAYRILVGKPEGKRPLGRPRRTWVDNIKMHLSEIGRDGVVR